MRKGNLAHPPLRSPSPLSEGFVYAALAGLCAALGSVFGKLALNSAHLPHYLSYVPFLGASSHAYVSSNPYDAFLILSDRAHRTHDVLCTRLCRKRSHVELLHQGHELLVLSRSRRR